MDSKLIGSILLIVGSCVGAAMLGLPIATAELGFVGTIILLFCCWFLMTVSAYLILEINLWLPQNSNLISMAKATVGPIGQVLAWITYLLLLYSLLCAYIAGGSDLLHNLVVKSGLNIPFYVLAIIFTALFGSIVYLGIRSIDYVNRGLMVVKFGAYFLLVLLLMPFISVEHLATGQLKHMLSITAITVTITSFGYATIIPSLRIYFQGDIRKLRISILFGSLIPLLCYIAWVAVIQGVIPLEGEHGLQAVMQAENSTSDLVNTLSATVSSNSVNFFVKLFTSVCVLTSFLGVALCLTDFLADGLSMEKKGGANILLHLITFIPPLVVVLFFPNMFIKALEYAGILCVFLLIVMPTWMAYAGRYRKKFSSTFQVIGGKPLLIFCFVVALGIIAGAIL